MKQPAVFVAHGGGPLPLLGHPGHASLTKWLQSYSATLHAQPKAILVISAHWEVMIYPSPSLNDHNMTSKLPFMYLQVCCSLSVLSKSGCSAAEWRKIAFTDQR